jgi:hypothetical protein
MGTEKATENASDWVMVLLPRRLVKALDRYILEEVPEKTRSLALRDAFEDWCIDRGYIERNEIDPDLS